jgi:ABC-type bacteriocin/lantibiotic exporter with double-glycine peptidase domain
LKKIYGEKNHENNDLFSLKSLNKITFNKIFYRHQIHKNSTIQIENIEIYSKKIIAVLAKSDIEKNAIYNLLTKNYCPLSGDIEIDDFNLQKISRNELLNFIDIIEADPILFEGNMLENIAKMSSNFSQENIINFIKNFTTECGILSLKNNFFNDIEELNSEQKYWVCAMRALFCSPKILFIEKLYFNQEFQKFFDYLNHYKQSHDGIIFINNPPLEFLKNSDAVIIFKDGIANLFNTNDFIKSNEKISKLLT